jgi:hypothetical protein
MPPSRPASAHSARRRARLVAAAAGLDALARAVAVAVAFLVARAAAMSAVRPPPPAVLGLLVLGAVLPRLAAERLRAAAGPVALEPASPRLRAWAAARARHRAGGGELALRYGLLPLVAAVPLFRVHQLIVYGGALGEWQRHGAGAWLRTFAGYAAAALAFVVLLAAAARALAEVVAAGAALLATERAGAGRRAGEALVRVVLYLGVPALVVLRFAA